MYYYTPTKLFIDEDERNIGKILAEYGFKKVLVVYGKNSAEKSGLLDIVKTSLEEQEIAYILCGGVQANPTLSFVREALKIEEDYDAILAIGGGSALDTAKSISVSKANEVDPWEFNSGNLKPEKRIPVCAILTIAASGSEMSDSCVITNDETNEKCGFNSDLNRPLFALTNPKLTYGVSRFQTACGIVDIMMHTLERYISNDKSELADNLSIALLQTVYNNGLKAYLNPEDYDARKQLLLASSLSHNGLTGIGKNYQFRVHKLEHVISGFYPNVAHGAGLSACFIAYSKHVMSNPIMVHKYARLAREVWKVKPTYNEERDASMGIYMMERYFAKLGMPIKLSQLRIPAEDATKFALKATNDKTTCIKDFVDLDYEEVLKIYKRMF